MSINLFATLLQEITAAMWSQGQFRIGRPHYEYSSLKNFREYFCNTADNFFVEPEHDRAYGWNF